MDWTGLASECVCVCVCVCVSGKNGGGAAVARRAAWSGRDGLGPSVASRLSAALEETDRAGNERDKINVIYTTRH